MKVTGVELIDGDTHGYCYEVTGGTLSLRLVDANGDVRADVTVESSRTLRVTVEEVEDES